MKRALFILVAFVSVAAASHARDYTFLDPPTLAVVDFEVSMSAADKEASKSYYGQLISQAILSVLVQQNASDVVITPREVEKVPGAPVYATAAETRPHTGLSADHKGQDIRYYFPPIFKIFDKKYVEMALQNANFTTKDLYTKAAGAFNFADLDFLVLGNVYETKAGSRDAVGFNVRVLNTKRAEEVYSYSAVVDKDLHDLPAACALICQRIMRDILTSHCAQFVISKAADVKGLNTPFINDRSGNDQSPNYRLFWQSRQVEKDDNTVADSVDSDKREVRDDLFYWTLPGQYVISLYNINTQQVRTIPFTIATGDIKHLAIQRAHLEAEKGTITIGGIFPTDSWKFDIAEEGRTEQYWWEIGQLPHAGQTYHVKFENGEKPDVTVGDEKGAATAAPKAQAADTGSPAAEYHPDRSEIVIRNVMLSSYTITANSQPPAGASDVTGSWRVSTRLTVQSKPLPIDLKAQKDKHLMIADFGLQEKKALDMPRKTKVTFFFNPGFGFWNYLTIDDQVNVDSLWWQDKEKVTIESEYSNDDWLALPDVTYTFEPWATFNGVDVSLPISLKKADLEPSRDTVIIIDWFVEAEKLKAERAREAQEASKHSQSGPVSTGSVAAAQGSPARGSASAPSKGTPQKGLSRTLMEAGIGFGYGNLTYSYKPGSTVLSTSSSGADLNVIVSVDWHFSPTFALGVGALLDVEAGTNSMIGGAATLNGIIGDLSKSAVALVFDTGYGSGFTIGAGLAIANKDRTGATTVRLGYINQGASQYDYYNYSNSTNYPAREWGVFLNVGYVFGI